MKAHSKRAYLFLTFLLPFVWGMEANNAYPSEESVRIRYEFMIDMPKAWVSGILIMARTDSTTVSASLVNEFGFSLMDFSFDEKKEKVKLISVTKKLDKWYIRRALRSDLKHILLAMRQGERQYINKKRKIKYTFTLLNDTVR